MQVETPADVSIAHPLARPPAARRAEIDFHTNSTRGQRGPLEMGAQISPPKAAIGEWGAPVSQLASRPLGRPACQPAEYYIVFIPTRRAECRVAPGAKWALVCPPRTATCSSGRRTRALISSAARLAQLS